ncbi:hypothetical protein B0I08_106152 [Glaciihabitans tibetensis]|uniref:Uncharacterized protein n=1 Tax=Glaciihabitans tibetensis TaxID=1266600 RepID=A0A2T0VBH1_9MICO|nr:DUF6121 family protein [Glaciihabitans tibetensis]PRY67545.1 hypothetical protein B0I08_106152 [Glaciihabitans tibetensis]
MATPPQPPAPPPNRFLLPALATVAYFAMVIATFGFLSLFLGRDVISDPEAGTLLGPSMVLAAALVTFRALVRTAGRTTPWGASAAAVASVFVIMILVGGLGFAWAQGEPVWLLIYAAQQASSPFVIAAALLSGAIVLSLWAVSSRPPGDGRGIDRGEPQG